ncbi:MAG: hypothetical protein HYZ57_05910 [Acidobacteria bacterium]|nr:hypothetical protein [Acidobacteriota bacterium]MBI3279361.1 hypothetical protein [Acidobacteriota bacterium]
MRTGLVAAFLFPVLALADTVVLRDGTRHEGTFVNASSRRITMVDENNRRRVFETRDVAELQFGSATTSAAAADMPAALNRLREDVAALTDNNTLSALQRDTLTQAREVLRVAALDWQRDREFDVLGRRDLRDALADIRQVANSAGIRSADRQRVLDSIDALRDLARSQTRSRNR